MDYVLKMGLTSATFQLDGSIPLYMVLLNNKARVLDNSEESSFKIFGWSPSGPGDLFIFKEFKARSISCSVIDIVDIKFVVLHVKVGTSPSSSVVETLAKKLFKTLHFSRSLLVRVPSPFSKFERKVLT